MKQTLHIIAFAAVALAALISCAKEQFKENAIPAGEKIQVSISGRIGELTPADATKATAGSVVRVTWENGDKVFVYDGTSATIGTLAVTPDDNNASYALLSGTITASSASPAPTKLTLVCVKGVTEAPAIAEGRISIDLSTQNEEEVPFVLYSTIEYDAQKLVKANEYMPFSFATSLMTVGCTGLSTGAENARIDITKAEIDGVSTACELTIDGSGVTAVSGTTPGTITRTAGFEQADSRGSFKLALAADPAAPAARNILVHQGSKVSGTAFTSTTLTGGNSYNTVYQMEEYLPMPPADALSGLFTVADDGNGNVKKVYFSKGNLQATYTGSAYTWGFTANQYDFIGNAAGNTTIDSQTAGAVVDLFGWSTASTNYGISTSIANNYYGEFVDWGKAYCASKSILPDNTWRTLTKAEWQYLFSNHSYKWATVGGVNGYVIAPDDFSGELSGTYAGDAALAANNLVFLPAAGNRKGSEVNYDDVYGCYWSSTVFTNTHAWYVYSYSDNVNSAGTDFRYYGYSVRLVTESAGGYAPAVKVTGVTLNKRKTEIEASATETLVATVAPANATNKQVIWSSSDEAVATVDENGEVTGVAEGSAVITATTADGNFTAVCLVTVTQGLPAGVLPGVFTVGNGADGKEGTADDVKVHFSQGNLTYNVSTTTWAFYEHQYDYATGYDANLISLFTWGYSASTSLDPTGGFYVTAHTNYGDKLVYDKASSEGGDDWGVAYCESNNITVSTWRTLSKDEWQYLFNNHSYKWASVGGVNGYVIAPDDFSGELSATYEDDAALAANNLVFLPAAGLRTNDFFQYAGGTGYYWSSTFCGGTYAPRDRGQVTLLAIKLIKSSCGLCQSAGAATDYKLNFQENFLH